MGDDFQAVEMPLSCLCSMTYIVQIAVKEPCVSDVKDLTRFGVSKFEFEFYQLQGSIYEIQLLNNDENRGKVIILDELR